MNPYLVRSVATGALQDLGTTFLLREEQMGLALAELRLDFAWPEDMLLQFGGSQPAEQLAQAVAPVLRSMVLHGPPPWEAGAIQGFAVGRRIYMRWHAGAQNPVAHWGPPWGESVLGRLDSWIVIREGLTVNPSEHISRWQLLRALPLPTWLVGVLLAGGMLSKPVVPAILQEVRGRLRA